MVAFAFVRSFEDDSRVSRREGHLETIEDGLEDAEGEGGGHLASAEGAYPLLARLRGIAGGDAGGEFEGREEVRDADGERTAAYQAGQVAPRASVPRRRKLDMRAIDAMLSGLQK